MFRVCMSCMYGVSACVRAREQGILGGGGGADKGGGAESPFGDMLTSFSFFGWLLSFHALDFKLDGNQ